MLLHPDLATYLAEERARLERVAAANLPERAVIARVFAADPAIDRKTDVAGYSVTRAVDSIALDALGIAGDRHRQAHRPATGREHMLFPKGAEIRQHRHLFAVSQQDCDALSARLGVAITPELLGANLLIDRLDGAPFSLSETPAGTWLRVIPGGSPEVPRPPLAALVVFAKQRGCGITGQAVAERYGDRALVNAFREAGADHRGVVCSVEFPVVAPVRLSPGLQIAFGYSAGAAP